MVFGPPVGSKESQSNPRWFVFSPPSGMFVCLLFVMGTVPVS